MKISVIIAEFNPFHNGHEYIINEAKKSSDAVVCVMSGSFVQRGEVAVYDKWTRAKATVLCGADLVIELPTVFAVSTAERFAFGAISLLKSLGCIDEIVFGSEVGNIDTLKKAAEIMLCEPPEVSKKIKSSLSLGMSFASARQAAYESLFDSSVLSSPNNILAIEYIKAALSQGFDVKFKTVRRIGDYHSESVTSKYASATALRKQIHSGEELFAQVPEKAANLYKNAPVFDTKKLDNTVLYLLRTMSSEQISLINDVSEGLENALKKAALTCGRIEDIIDLVSGKRYTKTKISRILMSLLLGIDKKIIYEKPDYARVLSFNDIGRQIIKNIKENIPIIVKCADFTNNSELFKKDILATDLAFLCSKQKKYGGADFLTPPCYISK